MTPYQAFVQKWKDCERCVLHSQRTRIVLARGDIPADVLMCGEAPGKSENVIGSPFVGPAGSLLQKCIIDSALNSLASGSLRVCLTNIVACFPRDAKATENHQPPIDAIKACSQRLREFVKICQPRLIVWVGGLAEKCGHLSVDGSGPIETVSIVHPAAILRMDQPKQVLAVKRCVAILVEAFEKVQSQFTS